MGRLLPFDPIGAKGINTYARRINPHRLLKRELIWLWEHRCTAHGVPYSQHPNCFFDDLDAGDLQRCPIEERIGFFDIEATSVKGANWGELLSYAAKPLDGLAHGSLITQRDIRTKRWDQGLCRNLIRDMSRYDRLVVYWGKDRRFDLPFVRSRCLWYEVRAPENEKHLYRFPEYMEMYVEDLYDTARAKLCLSNRRMETVAKFLDVPAKEHRFNHETWRDAQAGDKAALETIWIHNLEDVDTTEAVWKLLHRFMPKRKTSI